MNAVDYKSAGVNIDAGNEAVERIKASVISTHNKSVLTGIGGFGSLFELNSIMGEYNYPILVQSIDGVGTKTIIAKLMNKYDSIGIDLVSACCNDITVMGAKPLTFLDYIASDNLKPAIIEDIVKGMVKSCKDNDIALVGGETAEMPDTYLSDEHDIVGIISGVVEKDKIIDGSNIESGNVVLGLPSTGLQTNGYSLARKVFFEVGNYDVNDKLSELGETVGEALLRPANIYNPFIQLLLENNVTINGMAHISGGGLVENIPRILPDNCAVELQKNNIPALPVFSVIKDIGNIAESEMYRTFNMGIGLVIILPIDEVEKVNLLLANKIPVSKIGIVINGNNEVQLK